MKRKIVILFILFISIFFIGCDQLTTTQTTTTETTISETTTEVEVTTTVSSTETTSIMTTQEITTTTTLPTTIVEYTGIEITAQSQRFFRIGEKFNKDILTLTAYKSDGSSEIIGSDSFSVRGFNSSTPGSKTLFVIFNKYLVETEIYVLEDFAIEIDMEYYEDALNLEGNLLRVALNNIINEDFVGKLYGDARYILPESDVDPNNSNNVILVYTGYSVDSSWDGGITWNREHTWPQSRLGVYVSYDDDFVSKATDLHNLKPADPDENAVRSNDYFSDVAGANLYEPRDEVKGDIARILFYMTTMYFDLTLNNDEMSASQAKTMGMLSILLEWNEMDPVDDFERHRNEVIYSYQNNRNPFIDYPEFANLIWGDIV